MRTTLMALAMLLLPTTGNAQDAVYEGTWLTTNRKLDGTMTCVVTDLGANQWRGVFSGTWQGASFTYTVDFSGPPKKLRGKAVIDGADYDWTGFMEPAADGRFTGSFGGNRYAGRFDLQRKRK
jgi:hypothetical protein